MRRYVGVVVLAVIFIVLGLLALAASAAPRVRTTTFSLLAVATGDNYCTHYHFDTVAGGTISITYTASPGIVEQYVVTEAQYDAYYGGSLLSYVGSDSGSNGVFTVTLPSGGSYEVMSCHAFGYETTLQSGSHTMTINALDPGLFYGGVGALVIGLILLGVAFWLRSRPERRPVYPYASAYGPPYAPPYPPPYAPGAGLPGAPQGAIPYPAAGLPPTPGAPYGTVLVTIENRGATQETVQLFLNGAPAVSIPIPAGGTSQATLHPPLTVPSGTMVRVEAQTPDGRRGGQDIVVTAGQPATVTLQIG